MNCVAPRGVRLQEETGSDPQEVCREIARQSDIPESHSVVLDDRAIQFNARRSLDVRTSPDVLEDHGLFDDALLEVDSTQRRHVEQVHGTIDSNPAGIETASRPQSVDLQTIRGQTLE